MRDQVARLRAGAKGHLRSILDPVLVRPLARRAGTPGPLLEALEPRVMLSASLVATPTFRVYRPLDSAQPLSSQGPVGLTPSIIRQAYGFNQVSFRGITGDGSGQTIALVEAYDDPDIVGDLQTFDTTFGLATPTLTRVNQSGGTTLPAPDPNQGKTGSWGIETSLDVEWAHAAAPGASILLVETNSSGWYDLFAGMIAARDYTGVSVVSMSWAVSEFLFEAAYDSYFATPANHVGVTFIAGAGDTPGVLDYPAASPNVLSVGGTTLSTDSQGNYLSESAWSSSGGGTSAFESEPSYQVGIVPSNMANGQRAIPDVAIDGNPSSGVAIADSFDNGATAPWMQIGGTSLSAPLWAAVIAIADQGRVLAGSTTLDGPSQTLPALYALAGADFHDITSGSNGHPALPGYDLASGLGSPIVNLVVAGLATPPAVTGVYLGSTSWSSGFTSYLTSHSLGSSQGYLLPTGASQHADLPWVNLNTISVTFSANISITSAALTLTGVNQTSYTPSAFSYNASTHTATWTLPAVLGPDKLNISLSAAAIHDTSGNPLAGAWVNGESTYPSGAGQADTDFDFRINIVPGDINQSGTTNATDLVWSRIESGQSGQVFADLDGSGAVDGDDINEVRQNIGATLPTGDPVTPAFIPAEIAAPAAPAAAPAASALTDTDTIARDRATSSPETAPVAANLPPASSTGVGSPIAGVAHVEPSQPHSRPASVASMAAQAPAPVMVAPPAVGPASSGTVNTNNAADTVAEPDGSSPASAATQWPGADWVVQQTSRHRHAHAPAFKAIPRLIAPIQPVWW